MSFKYIIAVLLLEAQKKNKAENPSGFYFSSKEIIHNDTDQKLGFSCDSGSFCEVREIASLVRDSHSTVGNKMENSELQVSNTYYE